MPPRPGYGLKASSRHPGSRHDCGRRPSDAARRARGCRRRPRGDTGRRRRTSTRRHVAHLLELIEDERLECVADLQRSERFASARGRSRLPNHGEMLLRDGSRDTRTNTRRRPFPIRPSACSRAPLPPAGDPIQPCADTVRASTRSRTRASTAHRRQSPARRSPGARSPSARGNRDASPASMRSSRSRVWRSRASGGAWPTSSSVSQARCDSAIARRATLADPFQSFSIGSSSGRAVHPGSP